MSENTKTTSSGTTITIEDGNYGPIVILDHPNAPDDMRNVDAGRIVDNSFQPAPFCKFTMSPETLRAVADLIEATTP